MPDNKWAALLSDMSSGSSTTWFLKAGRTQIRLLVEPGEEEESTPTFFGEVQTYWKGKARTKIALRALILASDGGDISVEKASQEHLVIVPKSALKAIIGLLMEGYDLLSEAEGRGIAIIKTGRGLGTSYSVVASPNAVPLDMSHVNRLEGDIWTLCADFSQSQMEKDLRRDDVVDQPGPVQQVPLGGSPAASDDWA